MDTKTKTAIITGGASGLGFAIAKKFVENNIKTIIIGRNENSLAKTCKSLGELCSYKVFDLSNLKGIPRLLSDLNNEFGPVDILVNNAGINQKKAFTGVTDEEFQQVILTNLTSVFVLSREVAAKILIGHLDNNNDLQQTHSLILRSELIIRDSSLKKAKK